mmetsp:Transcript_18158/g.51718  ORF Transcript_18158/g.51718 Transcript_18158/m.51718 type:complete len:225 (+) Transcript_18158:318-992(+)
MGSRYRSTLLVSDGISFSLFVVALTELFLVFEFFLPPALMHATVCLYLSFPPDSCWEGCSFPALRHDPGSCRLSSGWHTSSAGGWPSSFWSIHATSHQGVGIHPQFATSQQFDCRRWSGWHWLALLKDRHAHLRRHRRPIRPRFQNLLRCRFRRLQVRRGTDSLRQLKRIAYVLKRTSSRLAPFFLGIVPRTHSCRFEYFFHVSREVSLRFPTSFVPFRCQHVQ